MRRDRAVPHLGRANGEMIGAVGQKRHLRSGAVLGRGSAFQPGYPHPPPREPLRAIGLFCPAPARQSLLHPVHALIEPIAAVIDIRSLRPDGLDPVALADHVEPPNRKWIEPEKLGQIVNRGFDRERSLRGTIAAKAAGRYDVGVDRVAVGPLVGATVSRDRTAERRSQGLAAMAAVGSGVRDDMYLDRRQRTVALGA